MTARLRRLRALLRRDARELRRDPLALGIAIAGPALLMLLFAFGVSLDTERVRVAIVIEQTTPEAQDLAGAFRNARYFTAFPVHERRAAEAALARGEVNGLIVIGGDFARPVLGEAAAPVQVLVDGVDGRTGRMVASYAEGAVASWIGQRLLARQTDAVPAARLESRIWFNREIRSRHFIAPGLIALVMTVSGAMLAALLVAREWDRGTMEALLATPATPGDLILARFVALIGLGMLGMGLSLALAVLAMEVPFRGSVAVLTLSAALFMVASLSLGVLVSGVTRNQVRAGRLTLTVGYLPTIMLSGLLFDLRNAPDAIQWLSHLVAGRYFVAILHTLFLAGNLWSVILPNLAGMAAIAALLLAAVARVSRRRLG